MDAVTKHKFSKKTCCSGNLPPTVNRQCTKNAKPSHCTNSFLGIYKERCQEDIGSVNHDWFFSDIWTRSEDVGSVSGLVRAKTGSLQGSIDKVAVSDLVREGTDVNQGAMSDLVREGTDIYGCAVSDLVKGTDVCECAVTDLVKGRDIYGCAVTDLVRENDVYACGLVRKETGVHEDTVSDLVRKRTADVEEKQILEDFTFKTPNRKLYVEKSKQLYSTPLIPSPLSTVSTLSLFSPDEPPVSRRKYLNTSIESPFTRQEALSPATPGSLAFTPNQASTSNFKSPSPYTASHLTSAGKLCSPYVASQSFTLDDTPTFMEQLLVNRRSGCDAASPLDVSCGSSNKLIPLSLGMDREANLSWTSSLATPPINSSETSVKSSARIVREPSVKQSVVIARALFTDSNIADDTWTVDSQNATELFDLANASSDEDETEMTVENEQLEATLQHKEETEMTIENEQLEATLQHKDETDDIMLLNKTHDESTLNEDAFQRLKYADKIEEDTVIKQLQCSRVHQQEEGTQAISKDVTPEPCDEIDSVENDHIPEISMDLHQTSKTIVDEKHIKRHLADSKTLNLDSDSAIQHHLDSATEVGVFSENVVYPDKIETPLSQVIVNEILSKFSPDDNSNIADTLAFLLDTPPERRQKLSKKKPPPKKSSYKRKGKRKRKTSKKNDKQLEDNIPDSNTQDSLIDTTQESPEDHVTKLKQSTQQLTSELQGCSLPDNKKDEPTPTPTHVVANINNSNGAMVMTPSSQRGQLDPFSQISPSFIDALCKVTDAVSANTGEGEQCKAKFENPKINSCHPEDNRCNILPNGAAVDNFRYNSLTTNKDAVVSDQSTLLNSKTIPDTASCSQGKPDAGDHSRSIPKQNQSKSLFVYPSEIQQKVLQTVSGTLFDAVLSFPANRPSFTYSTKDTKLPSPNRFEWMKNATIVKEDSDEEDNKEVTNEGDEQEKNITSLPTYQEKPRRPPKKDFVTFSSFFDDEIEGSSNCDESRNNVCNTLNELTATPVSRKGKHLQRKHGKYGQPRSKRVKVEELPAEEVDIVQNLSDIVQDKELSMNSKDSNHSISKVSGVLEYFDNGRTNYDANKEELVTKDSLLNSPILLVQLKNTSEHTKENHSQLSSLRIQEIDKCLKKSENNVFEAGLKPGGFTSSSGKEIKISDSSWKKANTLIAVIDSELNCTEKNAFHDDLLLDKVQSSESQFTSVKARQNEIEVNTITDSNADSVRKTSKKVVIQSDTTPKATTSKNILCEMLKHDNLENFDDDFVTATQAQKEIAAADEAEMVYAFMQEEEDNMLEEVNIRETLDNCSNVQFDNVEAQPDNIVEFKVPDADGGSARIRNDGYQMDKDESEKRRVMQDSVNDVSAGVMYNSIDLSYNRHEMDARLQTRRGSQVSASIQTLGHGQILNQDTDDEDPQLDHVVPNPAIRSPDRKESSKIKQKPFVGFMTGSGKKVNISEDALKNVKQTFYDESGLCHTDNQFELNNSEQSINVTHTNIEKPVEPSCTSDRKPFVGFMTGRGNKVKISEESLRKVKQTFDNEEDCTNDMLLKLKKSRRAPDTMNVSRISTNNHATKHIDAASSRSEMEKPFVGFMTGKGNKVKISEESLRKVKQTFDNEKDCTNGVLLKQSRRAPDTMNVNRNSTNKHATKLIDAASSRSEIVGFMTGRGNKVNISEKSLKKVKQTFDDEDYTNDVLVKQCRRTPDTMNLNRSSTSSHAMNSIDAAPIRSDIEKPFIGFLTGRGNKVNISEESLKKVKQTFDNEEDYTNDVLLKPSRRTPNTMNVNRSSTSSHAMNPIDAAPIRSDIEKPFIGFMTGRGNKVNISEESLKKVKQTFDDEDYTNDVLIKQSRRAPDTMNVSRSSTSNNATKHIDAAPIRSEIEKLFVGFMTGRGNKVNIYEESLRKVKQTFDNEVLLKQSRRTPDTMNVSSPSNNHATKHIEASSSEKPFIGFMTGRGNKVKISEESLQKVKITFNKEEDYTNDVLVKECRRTSNSIDISRSSTNNHRTIPIEASSSLSEMEKPIVGFMTGRGNKVKISEESLKKVKNAFDNDNLDSSTTTNHEPNPIVMDKPFDGFKTGRGNKVNISEESLKKVKQSFDNEEFTSDVNESVKASRSTSLCSSSSTSGHASSLNTTWSDKIHTDKPLVGFITGNGKTVKVSEDSLKNVRLKFDEASSDDLSHVCIADTNDQSKTLCTGFQTAGGRTVPVSVESLKKVKMDKTEENLTLISEDVSCPGFITGRGKQVNISDDAIRHGKKLLCEASETISKKINKEVPAIGSGLGFHTARGSKVDISDDAIKHVRGVLQDHVPKKDNQDPEIQSMDILFQQELDKMSKLKEASLFRRNQTYKNKTENHTGVRRPLEHSTTMSLPSGSQFKKVRPDLNHITAPFKSSPEHILQDRILSGSMNQYKPLTSQPNNTRRGGRLKPETITQCPSDPGESTFITPFKEGISSRQTSFPQPSRLFDKPAAYKARGAREMLHAGPFAKKLKLDVSSEGGAGDNQVTAKLGDRSCDGNCVGMLRGEQMKQIQAKKNYTVKPLKGLLRQKRQSSERIQLSDAVDRELPARHTQQQMFISGVLPSTVHITAALAKEFRFTGSDHYSEGVLSSGGIQVADGGTLIFDDDSRAGKKEFYYALLDTPGVDPRLVTLEWVSNHYRWIVWKLASMERSYPNQFGGRLLTPEAVLLRLKYRYDREIDESQRSAIKMITERDDTPSKTMVLCVAAVHDNTSELACSPSKAKQAQTTLLLTDGWYSIPTSVDPGLQRLVKTGRLMIGQKIIIHGAELTGSQDACPPLEAPSSLRLKIAANSTRRVRYDTRLGYRRKPQPITVLLSSIYADGGLVGCLDVVVTRSYPLMYMERQAEGGCVFRTEKSERKAAADYGRVHQKRMEEIYDKIRSKFEDDSTELSRVKCRRGKKLTPKEITALQTGSEIHDAMESAFDPNSIKIQLSTEQLESLEAYRRRSMDKRQTDVQAEVQKLIGQQNEECSKRTVTPLLKVRLVDYNLCERSLTTSVLLTVWRPSEEVVSLMSEGQRLKIFNVGASAGWSREGANHVQLASNRSTRYKDLPSSPGVLDVVYPPRVTTDLSEIGSEYFQPDYQELDVVGLVMYATPYICSSRPQTVYISDQDVNILALKFWGGLKAYHVEEIMEPGSFVCISNLLWKGLDKRSMAACGHANEMTVITRNPRRKHLKDALQHLQEQIKDPMSFISSNQGVLDDLSSIVQQPQTPVTPYIQPSLPPLSTPRIQGTSRIGNAPQFTPSPGSFAIPQGGRTSTKQDRTPVLPRNNFTTPKSQDFRSYYSKRLYSKDTMKSHTGLSDQKIVQCSQQGCGKVESQRTSGQHQGHVKPSRTPLLSTPINNAGITFPLFNKKTITPKSQNFSSYYKNNASTVKNDHQKTPLSRDHLTSTPMSAKKENQMRMNSLKFENLSRIPSPPPLQPLINSQSSVLTQCYKKPTRVNQTPDHSTVLEVESSDMDDLELQALDAGFSNRTLALDDSGDFDFSEASPETCQNKDCTIKQDSVAMNLSFNEPENASGLSQISDISTQVLRDLDLSGLEEIASSTSSLATLNNDEHLTATLSETIVMEIDAIERCDAVTDVPNTDETLNADGHDLTPTITQLSETIVREIDAMERSDAVKDVPNTDETLNADGHDSLNLTPTLTQLSETIVREIDAMERSDAVKDVPNTDETLNADGYDSLNLTPTLTQLSETIVREIDAMERSDAVKDVPNTDETLNADGHDSLNLTPTLTQLSETIVREIDAMERSDAVKDQDSLNDTTLNNDEHDSLNITSMLTQLSETMVREIDAIEESNTVTDKLLPNTSTGTTYQKDVKTSWRKRKKRDGDSHTNGAKSRCLELPQTVKLLHEPDTVSLIELDAEISGSSRRVTRSITKKVLHK